MERIIVGEILELEDSEVLVGTHIKDTCAKAITLADVSKKSVHFKFNDTDVTVQPGELVDNVVTRWETDREAAYQTLINSDEYKQRQAQCEADDKAAREAHMTESAQTEAEMREAKVPWPKTKEQLVEYIESLVNRQHDYGTCVYAMSMAAEAAFNYVAGKEGCTGFQASCADLDFVRRVRLLKGPFMLIKAEDMLYPQYNLFDKLSESMEKWKPWAKEEAVKKLAETDHAHPDVIAHWKKLAE
jgi:hypothetical protein